MNANGVKDSNSNDVDSILSSYINFCLTKSTPKTHPILPKSNHNNILITSALPYINNVPHLGNIIGCVLSADVFARYCRFKPYTNTLFLCGTDEYGTATELKALESGQTPMEICDAYHKAHSDIYAWFDISFDTFGRTTNRHQTPIAQDIFRKLNSDGYIFTESTDQTYCKNCQRFLADRYIEGKCPLCSYDNARGDQCDKCGKLMNASDLLNPSCKICGLSNSIMTKASTHLFLDLPKLEYKVNTWFASNVESSKDHDWTTTATVITKAWLKTGLKPRCITRDLIWGTPVPLKGFEDKVFYVWYDAPIGYLSITADYTDDWEQWWKNPEEVTLYNFMAKDNVPFHSVIFPCCLLGTGENYTLVNHLIATEYLNYEDEKFSKSRGVGIFGDQVKETGIPSDIWRFYLLSIRPETQDSNFSWNDLLNKNNGELLNNLGNFVNRSLSLVIQFYSGKIPPFYVTSTTPCDIGFIQNVNSTLKRYLNYMNHVKIREALYTILEISHFGNQYIQENKPWVLNKSLEVTDKEKCCNVISLCVNTVNLLAILLGPFIPKTSASIFLQIDMPSDQLMPETFGMAVKPDHVIFKPTPLFEKLELEKILALKKQFAGPIHTGGDKRESKTPKLNLSKDDQIVSLLASLSVECSSFNESLNTPNLTADAINICITKQGNRIREMKANKSDKMLIQQQVTILLNLKKLATLIQ